MSGVFVLGIFKSGVSLLGIFRALLCVGYL